MRISKFRLEEGERIPKGMGIAWWDYNRLEAVIFPVPFNIVLNWFRELWYKIVLFGNKGRMNRLLIKAYQKGRARGVSLSRGMAYEAGLKHGSRAGAHLLDVARQLVQK